MPVPVGSGWEPHVRGYVQLSDAYDAEAAEARQRGWQVVPVPGRHLDLLRRPEPVARAVLDLLSPAPRATSQGGA